MLILIGVVVGITAGLVGIVTGAAGFVRWITGIVREKNALEMSFGSEKEKQTFAQGLRVARKNHATAELLQTTRARSVIAPWEDPWAGTTGTGGQVVRNDLRRRGISPSGHARGER